jgi:hypothetical protein
MGPRANLDVVVKAAVMFLPAIQTIANVFTDWAILAEIKISSPG